MVSRDQGEGGVAVETLVAVVSGALVILSLLLFIIVVLVVRKQNYLAKVSRYFTSPMKNICWFSARGPRTTSCTASSRWWRRTSPRPRHCRPRRYTTPRSTRY